MTLLWEMCFYGKIHTLWGMLIQHGLRITSLRKQPTFGNATTGFPANDVWEVSDEILYWWRVITQI